MAGRKHSVFLLCITLAALLSPAARAEPGITDNQILLGQSAAFTGPTAQLGIQFSLGAKVYLDKINSKGGVYGRRIEIRALDDQYDPDLALKNTVQLIEKDRVFGLFGYVGSPTSKAVIPLVSKAKIPFFAPMSGNGSLRTPFNRLIFNIRASHRDEIEFLLTQLMTMGLKNLAVFYQDDAYGRTGLAGIEEKLREKGGRLLVATPVQKNSTDVSEAVAAILPLRPDAVLLVSTYNSSAALIKALRAQSYRGQFYSMSFIGSQALLSTLGTEGAGVVISQIVPFPWQVSRPVVGEYQKAFAQSGIQTLDFSSLEGFIAAKVLVEGLRRAGLNPTREKFIRALETIRHDNYDVGGFGIQFSATNHEGSKFIDMTAISRDGKFLN